MSTCNFSRKTNQRMRRSERIKKLKAKSEAKFPHIPEEILVIILSKLPVKSLLRFRCVSQTWESLISDPKFNLSSPKEQAIVLYKYYSPNYSIHLINDDGPSIELPKPTDMVRGRKFCPVWRIWGSCNGLVLLRCDVDLFLWNPWTRCCKKVLSHAHLLTLDHEINASGLCYISSTDDYKVVVTLFCSILYHDYKVMVGSCRNKTWTEVCLPYDKGYIKSGPTVNERLHFLVIERTYNMRDTTTFSIAGFDPGTNEFLNVPMPKGNKLQSVLGLGVLDGCLCLAYRTECNKSEVEVVVMKKYGDEASWISLFIIPNVNSDLVPLFFTKNVVMFMKPGTSLVRRVCTYNGELNFCQDDIIVETHNCVYDSQAAIFVESLVSPPCYNWEEQEEYTEIFLSGLTRKWRRGHGDVSFKAKMERNVLRLHIMKMKVIGQIALVDFCLSSLLGVAYETWLP